MVGWLAVSGWAGKRDLPDPPRLEQVLIDAGWTPVPERSSTYRAGDLIDLSDNSKVATREQCFDTRLQQGVYTSLQVVRAMTAQANVQLGVVTVKGGGVQYETRTFAEPTLAELPRMSQQLRPECAAFLSRDGADGVVLLTAVLSAEVVEQRCTTVEAGAGLFSVGGEVQATQGCREASQGHVAVAYKTRPVSELLDPPRAELPEERVPDEPSVARLREMPERDVVEACRRGGEVACAQGICEGWLEPLSGVDARREACRCVSDVAAHQLARDGCADLGRTLIGRADYDWTDLQASPLGLYWMDRHCRATGTTCDELAAAAATNPQMRSLADEYRSLAIEFPMADPPSADPDTPIPR